MPEPERPYRDRVPHRLYERSAVDARRWAGDTHQVRVLDQATAPVIKGQLPPLPTAYVGPRVIFPASADRSTLEETLNRAARELGWELTFNAPDARTDGLAHGVVVVDITVADARAVRPPDGFVLLQTARAMALNDGIEQVGLDHVLHATPSFDADPMHGSHPVHGSQPMHGSHPSQSYLAPGFGARMPVAYVGSPPHRRTDAELPGRRPVVAVLDTGCGAHSWLDDVVTTGVQLDSVDIGHPTSDSATDPELTGDVVGDLDGEIDELSGHGTFIAGLVHQRCPDADIVAWRVVPSDGPIVESELVVALTQIAELARRYRAGRSDGYPIDVLNLSMGYYHESPEDAIAFDPIMLAILKTLADNGVVVVASAGNDATDRPCFPAAFSQNPGPLPVVSVGALNPNGDTDALFSNTGAWVTDYRRGAVVMSTLPAFQGGREPQSRTTTRLGRLRETLDPDDFRGGFGVWSGTSFSAPVAAAAIAEAMIEQMEVQGVVDDGATATTKAQAALAACQGKTT